MCKPTYIEKVLEVVYSHGMVTRPFLTKQLAAASMGHASKVASTLKLLLNKNLLALEGVRYILGEMRLNALAHQDREAYLSRLTNARDEQLNHSIEAEKRKIRIEKQYQRNYKTACMAQPKNKRGYAAEALMFACAHLK